jgi:glutamate---cysteine ligase / carboxylate-amine ligase
MSGGEAERAQPGARRDGGLLCVGIEEEFLLVDPTTGAAAPAVDAVMARVPAELRGQVQYEFQKSQIEIGSPPELDLFAVRDSLRVLRAGLAAAADDAGVRLLAIGTGPVEGPTPPVVDNDRFHKIIARYGMLVPGPGNNGMHVHVDVPDPEVGVQVLNQLRPWLPVLHAVTTNSPFYAGRDTGYASFRSMLWERWPPVAPTPELTSYAHYERLISQLIETGMLLDEGMLYWYARLSAKYPTVEIRVGDVVPNLDDVALVAALTRGLVAMALADVAAGRPTPDVDHHLLVAAHWRAAHDGMDGPAVDLVNGGTRPAWSVLDDLVARLRTHLDRHGDLAEVDRLLTRLRERGTGAARQRATFARAGTLRAVIDAVAEETRG